MNVHFYGNSQSHTVLLQMVDDHDLAMLEQEDAHIQSLTGRSDFALIAVHVDNWNGDLSPWPALPVYGAEAFAGKAEQTLEQLMAEVVDPLLQEDPDKDLIIGGYSLAGLFALWAATQTDRFVGVAAASPSVWFPGFAEYMQQNRIRTRAVYLSLGDREERTRNTTMAQVGDAIRQIHQDLCAHDIPCTLEWNPGNHFKEPDLRTAKGFAWVMQQIC